MSRRGPLEIKIDVLKAIGEEHLATWIMYTTRISWRTLRRVLKELDEGGLVRTVKPAEGDGRTRVSYELTPRGYQALDGLEQLDKVLRGA